MKNVDEYLSEFKAVAPEWFKQVTFLRANHQFFKDFFSEAFLERAEWADIQTLGDHLHCFNSFDMAKKRALGKPNHPIEHYRKSFLYLAHGDDPMPTRINKFAKDPEYRLEYFGSSSISEIAGYLFADDLVFFNTRDQEAAELLELAFEQRGPIAENLVAFAAATKPIAERYLAIVGRQTDLPLNLELDQFFSWLYERSSGKGKASEQLRERRYWTVSAGQGGEHWDEFLRERYVAIGWRKLGDLRKYDSKEAIREAIVAVDPRTSHSNDALACWEFTNVMKPGDVLFAKQGLSVLLGVGVVLGDYEHDEDRPNYRNSRRVRWLRTGQWELPDESKVASKTLTDVTGYQSFIDLLTKTCGVSPDDLQAAEGTTPVVPAANVAYWWLNANPKVWDLALSPVGTRQSYTSHNEQGNKRQKYKYFQQVKPGDIVVGYVTSPAREVAAICRITKALHESSDGEQIEFEITEKLATPLSLEALQAHPQLAECEPIVSNQGSLFRLSEAEWSVIRGLLDETKENDATPSFDLFSRDDALRDVFFAKEQFDDMLDALREKKNVILQGSPGVGKTFIAHRLAYALVGSTDPRRTEMVQFHQSYSYEDFIQGFRPTPRGHFELRNGIFHQFCRRAQRSSGPFVFIIDEINRGNLSKIFGELMMLMEADKRGPKFAIPLTYSGSGEERFFIPENVYIIGMMNTADRSLAMVDYALRRRFRFITLKPEFSSPRFAAHLQSAGAPAALVNKITQRMNTLNAIIAGDTKNLGQGYRVGHSFFCPLDGVVPDEGWYRRVVSSEVVPLLREYWLDDDAKVAEQEGMLLA